ncbi:phage tail tube protein, partial [Enterococcus casseliflavus]|uniref:phage tail tube protein n=2 Tax=Enterococcus TaxID=1350 RepID=UPI003A4D2F4F
MKNVNSERGHFIAPFTNINTPPTESAWVELADGIEDISDATTETTEEKAYYNGVKTNMV